MGSQAVPKLDIFHLHPYGWENDPDEERFKISTLDYLAPCTYNNYALFFQLDGAKRGQVVEALKAGLERTFSQARHLVGRIEEDAEGGHSFVRRKGDTVEFQVQYLDSPEDGHPTFEDIKKSNFSTVTLGDLQLWSVPPMTYGEKPEANPESNPKTSGYKANFVRGGLVFNMHHHHWSNDVMGWAGYTHQLAENCCAFLKGTAYPDWDLSCLDVSHLCKKEPAPEAKVDGPPAQERHPDHTKAMALLFHLPKSKAAKLKEMAKPEDGTWVSTYDAFCAFIWRELTRIRAPVFNPDPSSKLFWSEAIDMRRRSHNPKVHPRVQHNVMFAAISATAGVDQPTVSELMSDWPLWKVARYIRQVTDTVTQENLDKTLDMVATIRNKSTLSIRIDAQPPLSILMTDHRDANIVSADFGFGKPSTYRHVIDRVTNGVIVVYPSRDPSPKSDEGPELLFFYEKNLAQALIDDPEWNKYFVR